MTTDDPRRVLTIRIPPELHAAVHTHADKMGLTVNAYVTMLLQDEMRREGRIEEGKGK